MFEVFLFNYTFLIYMFIMPYLSFLIVVHGYKGSVLDPTLTWDEYVWVSTVWLCTIHLYGNKYVPILDFQIGITSSWLLTSMVYCHIMPCQMFTFILTTDVRGLFLFGLTQCIISLFDFSCPRAWCSMFNDTLYLMKVSLIIIIMKLTIYMFDSYFHWSFIKIAWGDSIYSQVHGHELVMTFCVNWMSASCFNHSSHPFVLFHTQC